MTHGLAAPTALAAALGAGTLLATALLAGAAVQPPDAPATSLPTVVPPAPAVAPRLPAPVTPDAHAPA